MNITIKDIEAHPETGAVEFVLFDLEFTDNNTTYTHSGKHRLPTPDINSDSFIAYQDLTEIKVKEWLLAECDTEHFKEFVITENQVVEEQSPLNKPW